MPKLRSATTIEGRHMAGARALWRATGVKEQDFGKPIIAIVNSYTQFVPGHVHLKNIGDLVASEIKKSGGIAREFNTIAVDDGIAMGHDGMLYSLPSRDLIADSVEYMVNAHCADAMICISNCDKITPGMLMACLRLNIPTIFVSGGPMEAGKIHIDKASSYTPGKQKLDLVDAMIAGADPDVSDQLSQMIEQNACPTCGSCSGMFTANSMNCLTEALGLAFPGNGSLLATHQKRKELFLRAGQHIITLCKQYYNHNDIRALPRHIANFKAFENAMTLDIAMGGSTNTILHLLAAAQEAKIEFTLKDIDRLSRKTPNLCKLAPSHPDYHMEDVHRAGGVIAILGELQRADLIHTEVTHIAGENLKAVLKEYDILQTHSQKTKHFYQAAPAGIITNQAFSQDCYWDHLDTNRETGCIRDLHHAYSKEGGLAVLTGNLAKNGCIVKTAGVPPENWVFKGKAIVFESQEDAVNGILTGEVKKGHVIVIRYEGPKGGPGMQEMLYPTSYLKSMKLDKECALITDGRFSGGSSGLSIGHISPEAANQGNIALIENGDIIKINIPERSIILDIPNHILQQRFTNMKNKQKQAWKPEKQRDRKVSSALKAYAHLATSADKGAVRDLNLLDKTIS